MCVYMKDIKNTQWIQSYCLPGLFISHVNAVYTNQFTMWILVQSIKL